MPPLIEDYALISDCHSAGLVSKNGSIDWLCFPRFDSAACFASLLGNSENGRWLISPKGEFKTSRKYVEGTVVLETTFEAPTGICRLTDCMLIGDPSPTLVRHVEGLSGYVDMQFELIIRFDYGSIVPWVRHLPARNGIRAVAGPEALTITSPIKLRGQNLHTVAEFQVKAGDKLPFVLTWAPSMEPTPHPLESPYNAIRKTAYWWKEWSDRCEYRGADKEGVDRSLLTLKALTYEPSGGIVAAPTTSLPEDIGGIRNWDYRFGWIRDSSFTLFALLMAGYRDEAERWNQWLVRALAGTPHQVNIVYGITGERRLTELELDWLDGYENSRPVRIGNAAYEQTQLDIFGELIATSDLARKFGLPHSEDSWLVERKMIQYLCEHWHEPDEGIWEIRGPKRHFTHSKVMAWLALDRAIRAVEVYKLDGELEHWKDLRSRIHRDICKHGYNPKLNSFVQSYGSEELDASLLQIPISGFLPMDDPRMVGTVNAIKKDLMREGLVCRYKTNTHVDGLEGEDGNFLACSFWMVHCLNQQGRTDEAQDLYRHLLTLRNDVGLFSEEYSTKRKRMLGNFPQAFTHISHITTAFNFNRAGI